jgi:putative hydrolase of the HAD superfamily
MNIPPQIRNIIFDLGGVVMDLDVERSKQAFGALGYDESAFHLQKDDGENIFVLLETGKITEAEFFSRLKKALPAEITTDTLREVWNRMIVDFREEKIRLLQELRPRYRTFLLSNTNSIHIEKCNGILQKKFGISGLEELFDKTYYSFTTGLRKPMPEIFGLVLQENGLKPEETLFIDDSEEHLAAAKKLGIVTRGMERNGEL